MWVSYTEKVINGMSCKASKGTGSFVEGHFKHLYQQNWNSASSMFNTCVYILDVISHIKGYFTIWQWISNYAY